MSGIWQGWPLPIRRWCAPVATALTRAMESGLHALRLRHLQDAADPLRMRGPWLTEYAALHAFTRQPGESDAALLARMQASAIGGRMVTTEASIIHSIEVATGITVRLRPSRPRVANFDQLARMAEGYRSFDFGYMPGGEVLYDNLPPFQRGARALQPAHGAWGPGGILVEVGVPYDPETERLIIQALTDKIPAQAGFELSWAKRLDVSWRDRLTLSGGGRGCWDGFGEDPFGSSPFGGECEDFDVAGFGVDPFGENFASRRPVPQAGGSVTP